MNEMNETRFSLAEVIRVAERVAEHGVRIAAVEENVQKVQASVDTLEGSVQALKDSTEEHFTKVDDTLSEISINVRAIATDLTTNQHLREWVTTQVTREQRSEERHHEARRKLYSLAPLGVAILSGPLIPQLAIWFVWSATLAASVTILVYVLAAVLTGVLILRSSGTIPAKPVLPPVQLPPHHPTGK